MDAGCDDHARRTSGRVLTCHLRVITPVARVAVFLMASCSFGAARADCGYPGQADALAKAYFEQTTVSGLPATLSLAAGECLRDRLVERLQPRLGPVVGYKAGLTSATMQKRFGADRPVRGVLLAGMITPLGQGVARIAGARPIVEADLLVEVRDERIHDARTPLEVLASLRAVIPFIELADLTLAEGEPLTPATITAINVGARGAIRGQPVPVEVTPEFAERLRTMQVVLVDASGTELAQAPGSAILGHPLEAVRWLAADVARGGGRLKAGDLLSLGAFGPPLPQRAGLTVRVHYRGLPGDPRIEVELR